MLPNNGDYVWFPLVCIIDENFQMQTPGDLYSEGLIIGGTFCVPDLGGFCTEGLIHGGAYFRNFTVLYRAKDTCFYLQHWTHFMDEGTKNHALKFPLQQTLRSDSCL